MKLEDYERGDLKHLQAIVEKVQTAMLVTHDEAGGLRARPLQTRGFDDQARLWFVISLTSAKVDEMLRSGGRVCLTYADADHQRYASITGSAHIDLDRGRLAEKWSLEDNAWYPAGVDDPDVVLLRVDIHKAEYWDRPGDSVRHSFGIMKALIFGDTDIVSGDQAKIAVRTE